MGRSGGRPYQLEVRSREEFGRQGGFLSIQRAHLCNLRPDGSRSAEWIYDYVDRGKGLDAVVLVLWRRAAEGSAAGTIAAGLVAGRGSGPEPRADADRDRRGVVAVVIAGRVSSRTGSRAGQ